MDVTAAGPLPRVVAPPTHAAVKLAAIAGLTAFHFTVYYSVNGLNAARPAAALLNFHTALDDWIPYWGWTSWIYYFAEFYILLWAAAVVWRIERGFGALVQAYAGMIVLGGIIQVLLPARAPFPAELYPLQRIVHDALDVPPYACLPSMHVALAVLPAAVVFHAFRSRLVVAGSTVAAVAISLSTLTAKEHFALDMIAGAALAALAYTHWRRALRQ